MCSLASDGMCNYCHRHRVSAYGALYCSSLCATGDSKRSSYASRSPASLAKSVSPTRWLLSVLLRLQPAPAKSDRLKVCQSPLRVLGDHRQSVKSGKCCNDDEERSVLTPANFSVDLHVNSPSSTPPHKKVLSNPPKTEQSRCATVRPKEVNSETKVRINKHHGSESPLAANWVSLKH